MAHVAARGSRADEDNRDMRAPGSQAVFSTQGGTPSPAGEPPGATVWLRADS
jgi:hypothetical protein